ncbi:hypothetical protein L2E82_30613 [Cichorium intybus]|uniref:Uncharacterized protein n=1 Tax=Cichorium intybus TaxID=13427 RepID=A0ACB9D0V3_CICIN|nr:hypothetical protein L2E82_30613 [Cichorium intybus]
MLPSTSSLKTPYSHHLLRHHSPYSPKNVKEALTVIISRPPPLNRPFVFELCHLVELVANTMNDHTQMASVITVSLKFKDMRCVIFVERVITARSQSQGLQNMIVDEFHKGMVNIIVATSIPEEGLDVQKCNLVIRFDPASTVCSFIQSRGRARMLDSDFLLLVKSGDDKKLNKVNNYLSSGMKMRDESLSHVDEPCGPLEKDMFDEEVYHVESIWATLSVGSSISMLYFYCSRLPFDGFVLLLFLMLLSLLIITWSLFLG